MTVQDIKQQIAGLTPPALTTPTSKATRLPLTAKCTNPLSTPMRTAPKLYPQGWKKL